MKFWGVSHQNFGEFGSQISWRFGVVRGGLPKCLKIFFFENDEQKIKIKNTESCKVRLINGFLVKPMRR